MSKYITEMNASFIFIAASGEATVAPLQPMVEIRVLPQAFRYIIRAGNRPKPSDMRPSPIS